MVTKVKGKLYYINCIAWITILDERGEVVNRRAYEVDKLSKTCKIRMNNKKKVVNWF